MSTSAELRPLPATAGLFVIAGSGSIGRRHFQNLRSLGAESLWFYRTGQRIAPEPAPLAPQDWDLTSALRRGPLAVMVCNPTARHVDVALAAARAGCHLFIEKPVSHTREGVAELEHEVRSRRRAALVGFQYRCPPGLGQVGRWLEEGVIGEVVSARVIWGEYLPRWHPGEDWRKGYAARADLGGGALLTLCHPFDSLRWLLGEVDSVSAETTRTGILDLDVEDAAITTLRFRSGALATVELDYIRRPRAHELEILGRNGRIVWTDEEGTARLHRANGSSQVSPTPPGFSRNSMFLEEMRHFLAVLEGREAPRCSLEDGVRALDVALAARESARTGRRVTVSEECR